MTSSSASGFKKGGTSRMEGITERAWEDYRLLFKASTQLKPLCDQILSMIGYLHLIDDHLQTGDVSTNRKRALRDVESWCHNALSELESTLAAVRSQTGSHRFMILENRVLDPNNKLPIFVGLLRSDRQEKIVEILSEMVSEMQSANSSETIVTEWSVVENQLEEIGLPKEIIEEEFFFISDCLKDNFLEQVEGDGEDVTEGIPPIEKDEELPDYSPGSVRHPVEEKMDDLGEMTRNLSIIDPVATSSKVEPPPYTFEEGSDQTMIDSEFAQFIETAKVIDGDIRRIRRNQHLELSPNPISWLPKSVQEKYKDSPDIIPIMPANSFTAMAYETAPRCIDEIERFRGLLRTSFEHKPNIMHTGPISEALQSLDVMSSAMSRFALLQDQKSGIENFSDLDLLDFEFSTAVVLDEHLHFPEREFSLAQKSYYLLLTYVMGFLEAMSVIFPGRTYISTAMEQLESSWKGNNMTMRSAWVEKQLAAWDSIENAASHCRDWHRTRPILRQQALVALENWQKAEMILSGGDGEDMIELTVIGASGLPKSNFRSPNAWVKVVHYGPNKFGGLFRTFELKTDTSKASQNPTWNKTLLLLITSKTKIVDFCVYDRLAGIDNQLCTCRLLCSFIPGVEANFDNKSLIYGIDEVVEFPLKYFAGKGKEKEPPILKLGLKWAGRMAKVEQLGLPIRAPGKMFRLETRPVPLAPEDSPILTPSGRPVDGSSRLNSVASSRHNRNNSVASGSGANG